MAEYGTGTIVTVTRVEPGVYPEAEPVIVAVPVVVELKKTEQEPATPVIQLIGFNEPKLVTKEIATFGFISDVEALIVDNWTVFILDGLADNDNGGTAEGVTLTAANASILP